MRFTVPLRSARWLRAVDVPSLKPQIFNYTPPRPPQEFEAFSSRDSARIEEMWNRKLIGEPLHKVPVEEDGLLSVDLETLLCAPTYWDGPAFSVTRSLWFEMLGNHRVKPVDPQTERIIEQHWQANTKAFDLSLPLNEEPASTPPKTVEMSAELVDDKLILREKGSWFAAFRRRYLFRGIPKKDEMCGERTGETQADDDQESTKPRSASSRTKSTTSLSSSASAAASSQRRVKIRPEYRPRAIRHLVFCVHGIGQLLSIKFEQVNFIKDVDTLRKLIGNSFSLAHPKTTSQKLKDAEETKVSDIQVLPVLWRNSLVDEINGLRPGQLFGSSNLAAEAVLDFIMYSSEHQRRRIQEIAASQMRQAFQRFCEIHPDFAANPCVSVIGHSLGAVISYDLVSESQQELGFEVENLFTLGSPLGVLSLMENRGPPKLGRAKSLYNILRLSDPVSTRLEPLVSKKCLNFGPEPLPGEAANLLEQARELTGGLVTQGEFLADKASSLFQLAFDGKNHLAGSKPNSINDASLKNKSAESSRLPDRVRPDAVPDLQKYNRHGRIDYGVKETLDISLILGLAGHLMYLDNPDVVMFILKEIIKK